MWREQKGEEVDEGWEGGESRLSGGLNQEEAINNIISVWCYRFLFI